MLYNNPIRRLAKFLGKDTDERSLFHSLLSVIMSLMPVNPAASVRGPSHVVRQGKTPVLEPAEARALLDSIDVSTPVCLRDRALIGLMVYSFAPIGAALGMTVADVYTQNQRLWVRLREKGGKAHAMPCHHNLEEYLTAYLDGAGLKDDPKGLLFRTIGRGTGKLTTRPLPQSDAHAMIQRCTAAAGIETKVEQSQLPGNRDHRLSEERRDAGKGRFHGQSRLDPDHAALRSASGRDEFRRG